MPSSNSPAGNSTTTVPARRPGFSLLWNSIKSAAALALIALVLSKTNPAEVLATLRNVSPGWLALAALMFPVLTVLKAVQYYVLGGRAVGYPQVLAVVIAQNAISNFVATGAGVASFLALFRIEHGVKLSRVALTFLLAKVGDLISIWIFLLIASLAVWGRVEQLHSAILVALGGIGAAILLFFVAVILRERFVAVVRTILQRLRLDRMDVVVRGLNALQDLVRPDLGSALRVIRTCTAYSMLYMSLTMVWVYASLLAFSLQIDLMAAIFANSILQLMSYLPIQVFGGLGVTEISSMYLYSLFGLQQSEIIAPLLGVRLEFYLLNGLVLLYLPVQAALSRRRPDLTAK